MEKTVSFGKINEVPVSQIILKNQSRIESSSDFNPVFYSKTDVNVLSVDTNCNDYRQDKN